MPAHALRLRSGRHTGAALLRFASVLARPPHALRLRSGRHTGAALLRFASVLARPPHALRLRSGRHYAFTASFSDTPGRPIAPTEGSRP